MKYAIIYFVETDGGGLCKDIQFRKTYDEVQDFLKNVKFTNHIYYVLEVADDITQEAWNYMSNELGKTASYEQKGGK